MLGLLDVCLGVTILVAYACIRVCKEFGNLVGTRRK